VNGGAERDIHTNCCVSVVVEHYMLKACCFDLFMHGLYVEVTRALGAALPSAASCDDVTAQYASQGSTGFHSHTDAPKQIQASYMSSLFERIPE